MPAEQNSPQEIGVVTGLSGEAFAQTASGTRVLEPGSPIFQGEELITGDNSNIEVRFVDDTLISQGGNSRISLDDYVYDPDGGASSFLGEIAEGTFRTVTGKIAEQNPDRFKLGSPLATIGIRGTIILSEVGADGEKHGVEEIHAGKAMLLQSKATGAMRQLFSGQMVDVGSSGLLSNVRQLSTQELQNFRDIAPANIRQEQEIRDQREDEQQDEQIDEQVDEQQGDEGQQGELPGDVDPGGGDPNEGPETDGGVLHPGTGILDPGDEALVGREKFDPDKINELPKLDERPQIEEDDGEGEDGEGEEGEEKNELQAELEEEAQQEEQKTPPEELTTTETVEDTTGTTEDNNDGGSDDSGSSSDPHNISGSGYIEGTSEADTITGSSSADTVKGLGGNDLLYGEAEDDEIYGGQGDDSLYGGAGEDMLQGDGGSNYLDGGSGESHETDFASFDGASQGVEVDLSNKNGNGEVIVTTADGQDTLINIEGVIGTDHKDTLTGDGGVNRFAPGLNVEYDITGAEEVNGGAGEDWIQFENLDSKYYVNVSLIGLNGNAEVHDSTKPNDFSRVNQITLTDIENILGSSGNDSLSGNSSSNIIKGADGNDIIDGGGGADTLEGGNGYDSIDGSTGNDSILGGDGNDFINAGTGTNSIDGGAGIDSLTYKDSGTFITLGMSGEGTGTVFNEGGDINDTFSGVEAFQGTVHNDIVNGSAYGETFDGNDGGDTINGHGGNDFLIGGAGDDEIYGGSGNDLIMGGAGNNTLNGGSLSGASGNDTLSYEGHSSISVSMLDDSVSHTISGTEYTDTIYHFATIVGTDGADDYTGATTDDKFIGGKGKDYFDGKGGNNFFDGGAGADQMSFEESSSGVTVNINGSGGGATHSDGTDTFTNVESFIGSAHDDIFNGSSANETFTGGLGDDQFSGGGGHDTLDYSDKASSVTIAVTPGGSGTATRNSGTAETDTFSDIDSFIGSSQNDTFSGSTASETFEGGDGQDSINGGGGIDFISFEHLTGGSGIEIDLATNAEGTMGTVNGAGNDNFLSIEGVIGSQYDDTITASSFGASTIIGGSGSDTINLVDGKPTKVVYHSLSEGGDTINNFQNTDATAANNDKLYFDGPNFDDSAGFHTFGAPYAGDAGAGTSNAYFVFDSDKQLWYDSNGDDAGGETLIAAFGASDDITVSDIEVG